MIYTDKTIFFELQKAGGTHVRSIIQQLDPDKVSIIGKHDNIRAYPLEDADKKLKVGNIRNPWDWYVSLWSFGCQGRGGLYSRVTEPGKTQSGKYEKLTQKLGLKRPDHDLWERLYSDHLNVDHFRTWLKKLLVEDDFTLLNGFKEAPLSDFAGFLTYRYLLLYTRHEYRDLLKVNTYKKLIAFDKKRNYMDIILRNERLHEELLQNAPLMGLPVERLKTMLATMERTNASKRDRDFRNYYDEETRLLVEEKEKFLVEKYQYQFEP
jgi:hypothetical protein